MARIYLDHAATTAVAPDVLSEMLPFFSQSYGNPSSLYREGREANAALRKARGQVAAAIGAADPSEIIFTGGGSEADNSALFGAARQALRPQDGPKKNHIITTAIEHHALLQTCAALEEDGFEVTYLRPDKEGLIHPTQVEEAIRPDSFLISVMAANNEIGSIQPIAQIGAIAQKNGLLFHVDGVQAAGAIPLDVQAIGVHMLSLSAHKFYGPKGVGALYLKKGSPFSPLIRGGAQERGRRGGTENIPAIVGMGAAIERAVKRMNEEAPRLSALRDTLIAGLEKAIPSCRLNGPRGERRLPGNVNFSFPGAEAEALLLHLDLAGIAASSGSACSSGALDPSHVLLAIGLDRQSARSSLRFTLGEENTIEDVYRLLEVFPPILARSTA